MQHPSKYRTFRNYDIFLFYAKTAHFFHFLYVSLSLFLSPSLLQYNRFLSLAISLSFALNKSINILAQMAFEPEEENYMRSSKILVSYIYSTLCKCAVYNVGII